MYDVCYRLHTGVWISYAQLRVVGPDAEVFVCHYAEPSCFLTGVGYE